MSKPTRKSALQICNSRCLQWHREIQKKQEKLQITWFLRNKERLYKNLEKGQSSVKYEAALKALRDEFIKQKGLTRENQILKVSLIKTLELTEIVCIKNESIFRNLRKNLNYGNSLMKTTQLIMI